MGFPPFLLPLNPDLSLLQNPATSRPIRNPILPTGHPPVDSLQSSGFISVLLFEFSYGNRHLFSQGEEGGRKGWPALTRAERLEANGFQRGCWHHGRVSALAWAKPETRQGSAAMSTPRSCVCLPVLTGSSDGISLGVISYMRRGCNQPPGASAPSPRSCFSAQALSLGPCLSRATARPHPSLTRVRRLSIPSALAPAKPSALPAPRAEILKFIHQSCQIKAHRQVSMATVYKTIIRDTSSHASISRSSSLLYSGLFNPITSILIISKERKKLAGKVVDANILQEKVACWAESHHRCVFFYKNTQAWSKS